LCERTTTTLEVHQFLHEYDRAEKHRLQIII
jgi:hypothetical protein